MRCGTTLKYSGVTNLLCAGSYFILHVTWCACDMDHVTCRIIAWWDDVSASMWHHVWCYNTLVAGCKLRCQENDVRTVQYHTCTVPQTIAFFLVEPCPCAPVSFTRKLLYSAVHCTIYIIQYSIYSTVQYCTVPYTNSLSWEIWADYYTYSTTKSYCRLHRTTVQYILYDTYSTVLYSTRLVRYSIVVAFHKGWLIRCCTDKEFIILYSTVLYRYLILVKTNISHESWAMIHAQYDKTHQNSQSKHIYCSTVHFCILYYILEVF